MSRRVSRLMCLCALGVLTIGSSRAVRAEVEWTATDGTLALTYTSHAKSDDAANDGKLAAAGDRVDLRIVAGGTVAYYNLFQNEFVRGDLPVAGYFEIRLGKQSHAIDGMRVRIRQNSLDDNVVADIYDFEGATRLFEMNGAIASFNRTTNTISLHGGRLTIAKDLAAAMHDTSLAGTEVATLRATLHVDWSGGDDPVMNEDHEYIATLPAPQQSATPRGGIGPDVVYSGCSSIVQYGPINDMYAYSLASLTCNIGTETLLWGNSHSGTPALAMNAYRIHDGRLEQIGQSWVKHSCCAAAGSQCGGPCTGGGGSQLGAGCSDVYGAGYNGGQSRLGPRAEINAFTGNITPAPGTGGTDIEKRLQVHRDDMTPANFPGARYLVEGVYVGSDDAAAGNGWNNASYQLVGISPTNFSMAMMETMQESIPAIYAWRDHGNGTNMVDNRVEVQRVDVPGEGIYHIASKVTDNGDGTWRYDYAVFNLNSDRSGGSFSVPLGAASVSNIGFRDVPYHSGEPYDNTDWTVTNDGVSLTWSSPQTFAENANSNALRWGTMYNFWFTADVGPNDDPADVTLGLFKPGTPTSVTATTQVPLAGEIIIRVPAGAPEILPTCQSTSFDVEMKDGSETLLPQTAKLHYRYDGGAFVEVPLVPMGGETFQATLPTPTCGDTPEYYLSARSDLSTYVTSPRDAESTQTYYEAQPGFADTLVYLETDFEGGLPAGWSANGLWNVSSTCSGIASGTCNGAEGSDVAYCGQTSTCDFDTGGFVNDSLFTPHILLPNVDQITMTYCSALERDTTAVGDWPEVRVTPDGQATVVVDEPAIGSFPGAPASWSERTVDLSAFAGQSVTIEFNFDNLFPSNDDKLGWQIDNVLVSAPGVTCIPGCSEPDADANGDNVTDGRDMAAIVAALMSQSTEPQALEALDFDNDGVVSTADIDAIVAALLSQ